MKAYQQIKYLLLILVLGAAVACGGETPPATDLQLTASAFTPMPATATATTALTEVPATVTATATTAPTEVPATVTATATAAPTAAPTTAPTAESTAKTPCEESGFVGAHACVKVKLAEELETGTATLFYTEASFETSTDETWQHSQSQLPVFGISEDKRFVAVRHSLTTQELWVPTQNLELTEAQIAALPPMAATAWGTAATTTPAPPTGEMRAEPQDGQAADIGNCRWSGVIRVYAAPSGAIYEYGDMSPAAVVEHDGFVDLQFEFNGFGAPVNDLLVNGDKVGEDAVYLKPPPKPEGCP